VITGSSGAEPGGSGGTGGGGCAAADAPSVAAAAVQDRLASEVLRKLRLATEAEEKDDRDIICAEVFADVTGELNSAARGARRASSGRLPRLHTERPPAAAGITKALCPGCTDPSQLQPAHALSAGTACHMRGRGPAGGALMPAPCAALRPPSPSPAPPRCAPPLPQTVRGRCTADGTRCWPRTSAAAGTRPRRCWARAASCGASPSRPPPTPCCCTSGCWCTQRRAGPTSGSSTSTCSSQVGGRVGRGGGLVRVCVCVCREGGGGGGGVVCRTSGPCGGWAASAPGSPQHQPALFPCVATAVTRRRAVQP
jgi:hypothetical protein